MGNLKKNFIYQMLYQVLAIVLPFISTPYVARTLGAEISGIYSYTHVIANYCVVFGMLGLEQYGNRCIAKSRDDHEKLCVTFSELVCVHLIVSIFVLFIYFIYVLFFADQYKVNFLIQGFYVLSVVFDVNWFFFGIEKFKPTVIRNSIIKLLSFVSIFIFVKSKNDLNVYTFIMAFSVLASQLALIPMLKKYVSFRKVTFNGMRKHIKPMLILFIAVIAANLNRMIDKAMLGWFDKMNDLGCYDYADRIIRIPLSLIAAFGTIMLSRMSNLFEKKDNEQAEKLQDTSACLILWIAIAMGFGIAAIAPEFVSLYLGNEYEETATLLVILSLSIPLVGWNNFVRTQMLIPKEMDSIYTKAVSIGAVVNIVINCFLINIMSARGAAIATVISYFVISCIQTGSLTKHSNIKKYLIYAIYPFLSGSCMYLLIRVSSHIFTNILVSVLAEVCVGGLFYSVAMIAYLKVKKPLVLKSLLRK